MPHPGGGHHGGGHHGGRPHGGGHFGGHHGGPNWGFHGGFPGGPHFRPHFHWVPAPVVGLWEGATVALAGVGGFLLGRSTNNPTSTTTTVVYTSPPTTSTVATSQSASVGSNLEATVNIITLLNNPSDQKVLFVDDDLLYVVQLGDHTRQLSVRSSATVQTVFSVNQTLYIPMSGNTKELQIAIYKAKDTSLLALGRVPSPQPQVPEGKSHDVTVPLNTMAGATCGRILLVISYGISIPRPVVSSAPPLPPSKVIEGEAANAAADSLGWVSTKAA